MEWKEELSIETQESDQKFALTEGIDVTSIRHVSLAMLAVFAIIAIQFVRSADPVDAATLQAPDIGFVTESIALTTTPQLATDTSPTLSFTNQAAGSVLTSVTSATADPNVAGALGLPDGSSQLGSTTLQAGTTVSLDALTSINAVGVGVSADGSSQLGNISPADATPLGLLDGSSRFGSISFPDATHASWFDNNVDLGVANNVSRLGSISPADANVSLQAFGIATSTVLLIALASILAISGGLIGFMSSGAFEHLRSMGSVIKKPTVAFASFVTMLTSVVSFYAMYAKFALADMMRAVFKPGFARTAAVVVGLFVLDTAVGATVT